MDIPKNAVFKGIDSRRRVSLINWISDFLHKSKSDIKRLLKQGAIEINGRKILKDQVTVDHNDVLKVGKKQLFRITIPDYFEAWEDDEYKYFKYRTRSSGAEQSALNG